MSRLAAEPATLFSIRRHATVPDAAFDALAAIESITRLIEPAREMPFFAASLIRH